MIVKTRNGVFQNVHGIYIKHLEPDENDSFVCKIVILCDNTEIDVKYYYSLEDAEATIDEVQRCYQISEPVITLMM
jgi:hypothetical protein